MSWDDRAACRGLGAVMDPPNPTDRQVGEAVIVCLGCPVMDECRAWVTSLPQRDDPGGVCGGMSELSRTRQRQRARGRASARSMSDRATEERRSRAARVAERWRAAQKVQAEQAATRFLALVESGYTQAEAARELRVNVRTIQRYAARLRAREAS